MDNALVKVFRILKLCSFINFIFYTIVAGSTLIGGIIGAAITSNTFVIVYCLIAAIIAGLLAALSYYFKNLFSGAMEECSKLVIAKSDFYNFRTKVNIEIKNIKSKQEKIVKGYEESLKRIEELNKQTNI